MANKNRSNNFKTNQNKKNELNSNELKPKKSFKIYEL